MLRLWNENGGRGDEAVRKGWVRLVLTLLCVLKLQARGFARSCGQSEGTKEAVGAAVTVPRGRVCVEEAQKPRCSQRSDGFRIRP